jgi:penicillin-binding protein 2
MKTRIHQSLFVLAFVFVIFTLKIWHLQIIKGSEYLEISRNNRLRITKMPAPRGIIYDTNNLPIVKNVPSFDISIEREVIQNRPREYISRIGELLAIDEKEIRDKLKKNTYSESVKIKEDIPWEEVAQIEARKIDFPELHIEVALRREYIYHERGGHIIGYLGHMTDNQIKNPQYEGVPHTSLVGQGGLEKYYDKALRGIAGKKIIEVDALGREISVLKTVEPIKGDDIVLTLDINIQKIAEEALENRPGSIVIIDPDSGAILAMASIPTFDPNLFSRGISLTDWKKLISNPQKPLYNRALQSAYPPGSTFKIITALAALQEGVVNYDSTFFCNGAVQLGGKTFRCWKHYGHGRVNLKKALVESCDVYFYEVSKKLGINRIAKYAKNFGLGSPVGLKSFKQKKGIIPSIEWKRKVLNRPWYPGETLIASIGQGFVTTTTLQMANVIAIVANGGKKFTPHIIKREVSEIPSHVIVDERYIAFVKSALRDAVQSRRGTGTKARSHLISIAGKTGTAQVVGMKKYAKKKAQYEDHAWFVAFAPYKNPEIAMAIMVEHGGHGGSTCAPIAKKIAEQYLIYKRNKHKKDKLVQISSKVKEYLQEQK